MVIRGTRPITNPWRIASVIAASATLWVSTSAADETNRSEAIPQKREYQAREERVSKWYAPARFGIFCHWGLFTGGGSSGSTDATKFFYKSVEEFEAAAKDPDLIASNLVAVAQRMGARYITFTLLHSDDRYAVLFPTKTFGFRIKTSKDYIGALAARCQKEHIPLLLYVTGNPGHGFTSGGPWLEEPLRETTAYVTAIKALLDELAQLHPGEISGFWIDGPASDLPAHMRLRFPGCIVIHNNDGDFGNPDVDYRTTEFVSSPPDPIYSRPSGLVRTLARWNILPPRSDFNEDIPNVGSWWYQADKDNGKGYLKLPYLKTPTFVVKEMVSSLGQRRQWNYALGIGPMIDGNLPPSFEPMVECLHNYFAWASESIYNTTGGEGSAFNPGWWNDGAYGSITVSRKDSSVVFVHVTTAPTGETLRVPNNGYKVDSVSDLRTGTPAPFIDSGVLSISNRDWSDVERFGDKVFKVTLRRLP